MLINPRQIPERNALNKYSVNLGATADEVKEYFDVSVYRNVLDMLNTFEGVLNRWGLDLHDNAINFYSLPSGSTMGSGAANVGYAIKMSGQSYGWNETFIYARKQCVKYGLKPTPPTWNTRQSLENTLKRWASGSGSAATIANAKLTVDKYMALKGAYFNVTDLLNLARQINWELNRVRLPIPHNFRQINEKIQGRAYQIPIVDAKAGSKMAEGSFANYITLMQLMDVYGQLKATINIMRVSTRKEIDAANLAKKVQEETLRLEQEQLISRQQAAAEAEARELQILADKRAAYEKEILEAEALKIQLAETRAALALELESLEAAKSQATETEMVAIIEEEATVIDAAVKVDEIDADITNRAGTLVEAATNLNAEIVETEARLVEEGKISAPKKTNLTPIILTAITGLLLS